MKDSKNKVTGKKKKERISVIKVITYKGGEVKIKFKKVK